MVNTFLDAYTLSDANVRRSFERLLQTWKNGLPGGRPVFPRHIIEPIERSIMYIREKQGNQQQQQQQQQPINIHVNPNFVKKVIIQQSIFFHNEFINYLSCTGSTSSINQQRSSS